jgi:hypothetical protein
MTILPESEDHFHQLSETGSYEWSYFDGISDDGQWGFVAIWFRGAPLSPWYSAAVERALRRGEALPPLRHCAFHFSLFHRGKRIYSALHERDGESFHTDYRTPDVRLRDNSLYANAIPAGGTHYAISVDTEFPRQTSRVVGEIAIRSEHQELKPLLESQLESQMPRPHVQHFWVPAALAGNFTAELGLWRLAGGTKRISFGGRAYHDRNFGTEPLHHLPGNWLRGHAHSGERTFLYFHVGGLDTRPQFQHALLLEKGTIVAQASSLTLVQADPKKKRWGIGHAGILHGTSKELEFTVTPRWCVDAGPLCHRSIQSITVRQQGAQWPEQTMEGVGIGEVLRPDRAAVAWIRPLVKFGARRTRE